MMDENKFWLSLWTVVACVVAIAIASIAAVNIYDTRAMQLLVLKGTDPLRAHCAIKGPQGAQGVCSVLAAK